MGEKYINIPHSHIDHRQQSVNMAVRLSLSPCVLVAHHVDLTCSGASLTGIPFLQSRKPSKNEYDFLNYSAQIPCIVCEIYHEIPDTPAEIHHLNGKTASGAHLNVLSLCTRHHRVPDREPKRWISRHGDGKAAFEARYATERELLEFQRERVEALRKNYVGETA